MFSRCARITIFIIARGVVSNLALIVTVARYLLSWSSLHSQHAGADDDHNIDDRDDDGDADDS